MKYFTDRIYNDLRFKHIPVTIIGWVGNILWVHSEKYGDMWVKEYELQD